MSINETMKHVHIYMPEKLLKQIDRERASISRSGYIRAILQSAKLSKESKKELAQQEFAANKGGRKVKK
jgi:metal-responsive CopG/Arc/MetJ family transcriptional regulator